jgi:hypothetical protein
MGRPMRARAGRCGGRRLLRPARERGAAGQLGCVEACARAPLAVAHSRPPSRDAAARRRSVERPQVVKRSLEFHLQAQAQRGATASSDPGAGAARRQSALLAFGGDGPQAPPHAAMRASVFSAGGGGGGFLLAAAPTRASVAAAERRTVRGGPRAGCNHAIGPRAAGLNEEQKWPPTTAWRFAPIPARRPPPRSTPARTRARARRASPSRTSPTPRRPAGPPRRRRAAARRRSCRCFSRCRAARGRPGARRGARPRAARRAGGRPRPFDLCVPWLIFGSRACLPEKALAQPSTSAVND